MLSARGHALFSKSVLAYCSKQYRVLKRIDRMIDEKSGKMRPIANTVLLENVTCVALTTTSRNCNISSEGACA
jgi:hypothetical protein